MANSSHSARSSNESARDEPQSFYDSSPVTNMSTPAHQQLESLSSIFSLKTPRDISNSSLDNMSRTLKSIKLHDPFDTACPLSPQAPEFSPAPSVSSAWTSNPSSRGYRIPFPSSHSSHSHPSMTSYTLNSSNKPADHRTALGIERLSPDVDMTLRTHRGTAFGQDDSGEPISCFVWAFGQHITGYHNNGPFADIQKARSFVSIASPAGGDEVFMQFRDTRDAVQARDYIRNGGNAHEKLRSGPITALCIAAQQFCFCSRNTPQPVSLEELPITFLHGFDGQVVLQVCIVPAPGEEPEYPSTNLQTFVSRHIRDVVQSFGDIKVFEQIEKSSDSPFLAFHVEFFDHSKADDFVTFAKHFPQGWPYNGLLIWGFHFHSNLLCRSSDVDGETLEETHLVFRRRWFGELGQRTPSPATVVDYSAMPSRPGAIGYPRPSLDGYPPRHPQTALPFFMQRRDNKNHVSLEKIRAGADVRTTIMLRNIPNRVDQPMLKTIVDHSSFGKYDFMYLRIDFANNCNVGYAFLNFQLPEDIVDFVQAVRGQQWFNSDKVAEVSYATMQGRECLVQKFRNSSVMQEHPSSRPKLYFTLGNPKAGQEEPFPRADNLLKLARSNQNASQIGLFNHARGSGYATPDRHRRGQYDRGTSFADMEELEAENRYLRGLTGMRRQRLHDGTYL